MDLSNIILTELRHLRTEVASLKSELSEKKLKQNKEWLSIKEACELANCCPNKLRQLIEAGHIISSKSGNKKALVVINRASINKYFEKTQYKPLYELKNRT